MKRLILPLAILVLGALLLGQNPRDVRLPDGRLQSDAILEAEYKKSVADATELRDLAEKLQKELEENDAHVLSVDSIRMAERIEVLAKNIKNRLKRN